MGIYHYTDIQAIQSIIENEELWLTQIRYLNDVDELTAGLDIISGAMNLWDKETYKLVNNNNLDGYVEKTTDLKQHLGNIDFLITSFCTKVDLLGQWKFYGNYAIEFDRNKLSDLAHNITKFGKKLTNVVAASSEVNISTNNEVLRRKQIDTLLLNNLKELEFDYKFIAKNYGGLINADLKDCVYDKEQMHSESYKLIFNERLAMGLDESNLIKRTLNFNNLLLMRASTYKDKGYIEEAEIRLSMFGSIATKIQFRNRNDILIPYYKFKLPSNCIKSIWIGPRSKEEQTIAKQSIEKFLQYTYKNKVNAQIPEVKLSKLSFRK